MDGADIRIEVHLIDSDLNQALHRLNFNAARAFRLLTAGELVLKRDDKRTQLPLLAADFARSAFVFMHAAFEDFIREVAQRRLPRRGPEVLNKIPVLGTRPTGNTPKASLGHLDKYRDLTVEELIEKSVAAFLNSTTFNSERDLVGILEELGVDVDLFREHLSEIGWIMTRRHQIVHHVDHETDGPRAHRNLQADDLWKFVDASGEVRAFARKLVVCLSNFPDPTIRQLTLDGLKREDQIRRELAAGTPRPDPPSPPRTGRRKLRITSNPR